LAFANLRFNPGSAVRALPKLNLKIVKQNGQLTKTIVKVFFICVKVLKLKLFKIAIYRLEDIDNAPYNTAGLVGQIKGAVPRKGL
jgi:hypothetical protein